MQRDDEAVLLAYERAVEVIALGELRKYGFSGVEGKEDAPATLQALNGVMEGRKEGGKFPVFHEGCEKTVFQNPKVNLYFRAWHDLVHWVLGAEFTLEGEKAVAEAQMQGLPEGVLREVLWADVVSQTEYFLEFGEFPEDQKGFVMGKVFGKKGG